MAELKDIQIETLEAASTLTVNFRVKPEELGARLAQVLPSIFQFASDKIIGQPFSRYLSMTDTELEIEAGMPVVPGTAGQADGDINASELPAGRAAVGTHVGPYDELGGSHDRLAAWIKERGEEASGPIWEVYVTDPGEEPDPNKWETKLYTPLK